MRILDFLLRLFQNTPQPKAASAKGHIEPAFIRDIDQCLRLADVMGERVATQLAKEFPFRRSQFGAGPEEAKLLGAFVSTWLVFTTSHTLSGIGRYGGGPASTEFGSDLRSAYQARYLEAYTSLASEIGSTVRPGDPFAEYEPGVAEVHPVTVVRAENHLVSKILELWYEQAPSTLEHRLHAFLQGAMLAYSERLGFDNPYRFFSEGGA